MMTAQPGGMAVRPDMAVLQMHSTHCVSMNPQHLCTAQHAQTLSSTHCASGFLSTAKSPQPQEVMQGEKAKCTHLAKGLFDDHPEEALALITLEAAVVNAFADLHRTTTLDPCKRSGQL